MATTAKKDSFDECESNILKHLIIWKEQEPIIRRALQKSADYILGSSKFKGFKDISDVEPELALMEIFKTYLKIPSMIKQEAEKRSRKKLKLYWKKVQWSKNIKNKKELLKMKNEEKNLN